MSTESTFHTSYQYDVPIATEWLQVACASHPTLASSNLSNYSGTEGISWYLTSPLQITNTLNLQTQIVCKLIFANCLWQHIITIQAWHVLLSQMATFLNESLTQSLHHTCLQIYKFVEEFCTKYYDNVLPSSNMRQDSGWCLCIIFNVIRMATDFDNKNIDRYYMIMWSDGKIKI